MASQDLDLFCDLCGEHFKYPCRKKRHLQTSRHKNFSKAMEMFQSPSSNSISSPSLPPHQDSPDSAGNSHLTDQDSYSEPYLSEEDSNEDYQVKIYVMQPISLGKHYVMVPRPCSPRARTSAHGINHTITVIIARCYVFPFDTRDLYFHYKTWPPYQNELPREEPDRLNFEFQHIVVTSASSGLLIANKPYEWLITRCYNYCICTTVITSVGLYVHLG